MGRFVVRYKEIEPVEPHWETPPPMQPIPEAVLRSKGFVNLTGLRMGRLTVIGFSAMNTKAPWVVRCTCGDYELRRTKGLRKEAPSGSQTQRGMCNKCWLNLPDNLHRRATKEERRKAYEAKAALPATREQLEALV